MFFIIYLVKLLSLQLFSTRMEIKQYEMGIHTDNRKLDVDAT